MILRFLSFVTDFFVPRRVLEDFRRLLFLGFSVSQDESKCVEPGLMFRWFSNTVAIYDSNHTFHLISRVCVPPLITCGTYNVTFSLFITGPFSDHIESLSSVPGGYSGNSVQSGNHLSTLRKILPKKAETFNLSLISDEKNDL